eukprot:4726375-Alexandrium_andersonii.AAC.1
MSASLVGSEMCIRDRPRAAENCLKRHCPFVAAPLQPPDNRNSPRKDQKPVSYTHLTLPTICSV